MFCIVPNCNNSIGMPFPDEPRLREKWIQSLDLPLRPNEKSFVCLDHFSSTDIIEQTDVLDDLNPENVRNLVVLRKGAVPFQNDGYDSRRIEEKVYQACRVCNGRENLEKSIFEGIDDGTSITSMIMLCCYPIVITKSDNFPKFICKDCLNQLQKCFKFRIKCLKTNKMLSEHLKKHLKRKSVQPFRDPKKICAVKTTTNEESIPEETGDNKAPDLKEELFEDSGKDLKVMNEESVKCHELSGTTKVTNSIITEDGNTNAPKEFDDKRIDKVFPNVNLPKGIRIVNTSKQLPETNVGTFPCIYMKGPQESAFVLADGYLFTFRLVKGDTRYLKCIVPTCKSKGKEIITPEDEKMLSLQHGHNHSKPDNQMRKKHMFSYIMRKRMQLDKSLNIRMIYEQICVQEPEIKKLVPLRNVINEICKIQTMEKMPCIKSFENLYNKIEDDVFEKLHFTCDNKQFYQERFATDDGCYAIIFCNRSNIESVSSSNLMYVDASFNINSFENFEYHLVTVLVWIVESYYPIMFGLVNKKSQEIFVKIFKHLHDVLAPKLRPYEIVTDYESSLYYALGETYLESHIGGSVYYYTQNIYKKICSLNLAKDLESNSNFRNIYHMLLMLPLLPVNTIGDALNTIKVQAKDLGLCELINPIFDHITEEWIKNVTPELFCVHRLENRINENVIAPFKKLRDYLLLCKGKMSQANIKITPLIEKLIDLEAFLRDIYTKGDKKTFTRDLSSFQKRNVMRAWLYIETHPKININNFFQKVLGYIKCMENQLWIWGFYGYTESVEDVLISASNFEAADETSGSTSDEIRESEPEVCVNTIEIGNTIVMEAVIDNNGGVVIQSEDIADNTKELANSILTYVHYPV